MLSSMHQTWGASKVCFQSFIVFIYANDLLKKMAMCCFIREKYLFFIMLLTVIRLHIDLGKYN